MNFHVLCIILPIYLLTTTKTKTTMGIGRCRLVVSIGKVWNLNQHISHHLVLLTFIYRSTGKISMHRVLVHTHTYTPSYISHFCKAWFCCILLLCFLFSNSANGNIYIVRLVSILSMLKFYPNNWPTFTVLCSVKTSWPHLTICMLYELFIKC